MIAGALERDHGFANKANDWLSSNSWTTEK